MKHIKRIYAILLVIAMTAFMFALPVSAKNNISDYQNSVVFIGATVKFTSANFGFAFTTSGSGTGFAVGKPGEKIQYIATCAHVVGEPSGIYALYINPETYEYVDFEPMPEGTQYPYYEDVTVNGATYTVAIDYFATETIDLYALFSNSSNDYTTLTIAQINEGVDLALCKLASAPTDKISALPLQLKNDVEVNTDIIAIGYPSTSRVFDAENRFDSSSSVVKDGNISTISRIPNRVDSLTSFDAIEVSADLITGMSGGPIISEESGAIVGVTSFGITDVSQAASANYGICIDYLLPMLESESVDYVIYTGGISPVLLIAILAAAVLAVIIVLVVVLSKKKTVSAPVPAPAPMPEPAPAPMPAPAQKYYLLGVSGPLNGKKYGITSSAVIGRDTTKCNVTFPVDQPGVSGVHCEVKISGSTLVLKDCGSSYGTFLENGTKLEPNVPVVLASGTKFYVGSSNNIFEVKY